jgi:hypothetical protein
VSCTSGPSSSPILTPSVPSSISTSSTETSISPFYAGQHSNRPSPMNCTCATRPSGRWYSSYVQLAPDFPTMHACVDLGQNLSDLDGSSSTSSHSALTISSKRPRSTSCSTTVVFRSTRIVTCHTAKNLRKFSQVTQSQRQFWA